MFVIFVIFNYKNNEKLNNNKLYNDKNIMPLNNTSNTFFNKEIKNSNFENILLVASDENNKSIFKYNNTYYKLNDNEELVSIEDNSDIKKYDYYEFPLQVPVDPNLMKLKINLTFNNFKYVGILSNKYYQQQYILYEKPYDKDYKLEEKLYYYILVKIINGVYTIMYELEPRYKIKPEEYIWASNGAFQIGPLVFN